MNKPKWVVNFYNEYGIYPIAGGNDDDEEAPQFPGLRMPEEMMTPRLQELENFYRQYIGSQYTEPTEWGEYGNLLRQLMSYTPEQFAFPMEDIQRALTAQQALQLENWQQQINPMLANQGQLDSSYATNLLGNYLQGQQAQTYGTTADLLTQQALNNLQLSQWLPLFQSGMGSQLANLGTSKLGLQQQNFMLPLNTYIPGLENIYNTLSGRANQQYSIDQAYYNQAMNEYNQKEAERSAMYGSLMPLAGAGLGALFALPTGGMSMLAGAQLGSALGGYASPFFGGTTPSSQPGLSDIFSMWQNAFPTTPSTYYPQWSGGGNAISNYNPSSFGSYGWR